MPAWLEGREAKIRRATRRDLASVERLVGHAIPLRFGRRALADRRADVWVAEEAGGGIVGVMGLAYRRSLSLPGVIVDVDPLVATRPIIRDGLLDFARTRARGRGCAMLVVPSAAAPGWNGTSTRDVVLVDLTG